MDFVIFKELNQKEQELNKEYANLSRSILELNGGAFSYKLRKLTTKTLILKTAIRCSLPYTAIKEHTR